MTPRAIGSPWHEADPLPLGAHAYVLWSASYWRAVTASTLRSRR